MLSVILVALIALIAGAAYLLFPKSLLKISQWANRVIFQDDFFIRKNRMTGGALIIVGVWLLWIYFHQLT